MASSPRRLRGEPKAHGLPPPRDCEALRVQFAQRAVAAEIKAAMRRAGAEGTGIDTIVASGPNPRPIQAQQACASALRPGIEGRQVEAIGRRIAAESDLERYFLYSGVHSVGVIEFEPPIFGPSSPATLKENMVITIDIPLFNTPWGGLRIESGYLITATGAEPLQDTPYSIQRTASS